MVAPPLRSFSFPLPPQNCISIIIDFNIQKSLIFVELKILRSNFFFHSHHYLFTAMHHHMFTLIDLVNMKRLWRLGYQIISSSFNNQFTFNFNFMFLLFFLFLLLSSPMQDCIIPFIGLFVLVNRLNFVHLGEVILSSGGTD